MKSPTAATIDRDQSGPPWRRCRARSSTAPPPAAAARPPRDRCRSRAVPGRGSQTAAATRSPWPAHRAGDCARPASGGLCGLFRRRATRDQIAVQDRVHLILQTGALTHDVRPAQHLAAQPSRGRVRTPHRGQMVRGQQLGQDLRIHLVGRRDPGEPLNQRYIPLITAIGRSIAQLPRSAVRRTSESPASSKASMTRSRPSLKCVHPS